MIESETLKAAKISRSQAIAVALITALGGFVTAFATNGFGLFASKSTSDQHWIKIETVQNGGMDNAPPVFDKVRVTVEINGVSYSFPTNTVWAGVGAGMTGERYPLAIGAQTYRIKFHAFAQGGPDGITLFENRDYVEYSQKQIPLRGLSQNLNLTTPIMNFPRVGLVVRYSIE